MTNLILKFLLFFCIALLVLFSWFILGFWTLLFFWFICGTLDVLRHNTLSKKIIKQYFTGKGILTWLLSPVNLFIDLISHKNKHVFSPEDLPKDLQNEINEVKNIFDLNAENISKKFEESKQSERTMLFYKWYDKKLNEDIEEFNKKFKYIKTIGVSLFREKTSTSRHFGPLRITYRMLYNFTKIQNESSYIEVDGFINKWKDKPIFIFDDTLIHQSFNNETSIRYCAFIDFIRPSYLYIVLYTMLKIFGFIMLKIRGIFYKNWKMI